MALEQIKGELNAVQTAVNEAGAMTEHDDYIATLDKVNAARDKAISLNTELSGVIARYKANSRSRRG